MTRHTKSVLLLFLLGFLASCGCGEPSYLVDGSTFAFRLIDASTGDDVFTNRFNPFELEIINDADDTVDIDNQRYGQDGRTSFFLDPTGGRRFAYDRRARRTYYLVFDSLDTDTLDLFFVPRQDDCGEHMDNFEAYYNDSLVATGSGEIYYDAEAISKP